MVGNTLEGDGTWLFTLTVEGEDLICENGVATWFGGSADPEDNGETASGYPTKGHPDLLGCALPMSGYGVASLEGSPVPHMPFGIHSDGIANPASPLVRVFCPETGQQITVPIIDLGPSKFASSPGNLHICDLTVAAFERLGVSLSVGVATIRYRIIGGAKFVQAT